MKQFVLMVVLFSVVGTLTGCKGGGGAAGFIDGSPVFGSNSGSGDLILASLDLTAGGDGGDEGNQGSTDQGLEDLGGGQGDGDSESDLSDGVNAGTVHNPEPGSLALFAGGLALAALRRRSRRSE